MAHYTNHPSIRSCYQLKYQFVSNCIKLCTLTTYTSLFQNNNKITYTYTKHLKKKPTHTHTKQSIHLSIHPSVSHFKMTFYVNKLYGNCMCCVRSISVSLSHSFCVNYRFNVVSVQQMYRQMLLSLSTLMPMDRYKYCF